MTLDELLSLFDGDKVAAQLLYYLCLRHYECIRDMPDDARASILRSYRLNDLWQAVDCPASLDSFARSAALLVNKNFARFHDDNENPLLKWVEVLLPNIQAAIATLAPPVDDSLKISPPVQDLPSPGFRRGSFPLASKTYPPFDFENLPTY
jgi:hypothetical protein